MRRPRVRIGVPCCPTPFGRRSWRRPRITACFLARRGRFAQQFSSSTSTTRRGTQDVAELAHNYTDVASQWYATASGGRMKLDFSVPPKWYRMPKPSAAYVTAGKMTDVIATTAEAMALAANDFDFTTVTHVYIAASPKSAVNKSNAFASPAGRGAKFSRGEIRFGAAFGSNVYRTIATGSYPAHHLLHETMHTLGIPDLYDIAIADPVANAANAGGWDPMSWVISPGEPLVWHKRLLGWIDPGEFVCLERTDSLRRSTFLLAINRADTKGAKGIGVRLDPYRVFVIEAREPTGLDRYRGDAGVLAYVVDVRRPSGRGPIHVLPASTVDGDSAQVRRTGPLASATYHLTRPKFDSEELGVSFEVVARDADGFRVVLAIHPRRS